MDALPYTDLNHKATQFFQFGGQLILDLRAALFSKCNNLMFSQPSFFSLNILHIFSIPEYTLQNIYDWQI